MSRGFANVDSARLGTQNNVVIATSTVSVASSAFGTQTYQIRVAATTAVYIKIGDGTPTATTSDTLIPTNWAEYFIVTPGQKIAAIGAVTTVSVTEITQ